MMEGVIWHISIPWSLGEIAEAASALLAAIGLLGGWLHWRESALRRSEVLSWANEVITSLESLLLVCVLQNKGRAPSNFFENRLAPIIFSTGILIEQGRMFFSNRILDKHGFDKPPAYRGYRPLILDHILVAHQIALEFNDADSDRRFRMQVVAHHCLQQFVSLAQKEVGRSRTRSADTKAAGAGVDLNAILQKIDKNAIKKIPISSSN